MIVLKMLSEHPLVHVVNVDVLVLESGDVVEVGNKYPPRNELKVLEEMTLPMLAYGQDEVPPYEELWPFDYHTPPELGFLLTQGLSRDRRAELFQCRWGDKTELDHTSSDDDNRTYRRGSYYHFRRDAADGWIYHFFVHDKEYNRGERSRYRKWNGFPPFWLSPPVAEILPWREVVNREMDKRGYRTGWSK